VGALGITDTPVSGRESPKPEMRPTTGPGQDGAITSLGPVTNVVEVFQASSNHETLEKYRAFSAFALERPSSQCHGINSLSRAVESTANSTADTVLVELCSKRSRLKCIPTWFGVYCPDPEGDPSERVYFAKQWMIDVMGVNPGPYLGH